MKIDSSTMGMESARNYRANSVTIRRFTITDFRQGQAGNNGTLNSAADGDPENSGTAENRNTGAEETSRQAETLTDWQNRMQASGSGYTLRSSSSQTYASIRQTTIRYIFNLLFSERRNRMTQWLKDNGIPTIDYGQTGQNIPRNSGSGQLQQNGAVEPGAVSLRVLNYNQTVIRTEAENTAFSTMGTVRTSDGREISFNVNVGMSREFQQYYEENTILETFTMCDPLVINLDTELAELSDQTFYFDIDGDGELDQVSQLGTGSGYLALDKNGDGTINDGSELFGTASGNGFADLAKYDQDGNGWIDENDAVWKQLKIWCRDENGNDVLYSLADRGVGAICLQNASTDFTMKGEDGRTKGAVRSTGIFLYENGSAGTVQHIDVAKYDAQA